MSSERHYAIGSPAERRRSARASTSASSASTSRRPESFNASAEVRADASSSACKGADHMHGDAEPSGPSSQSRSNPRRSGRMPEGLFYVSKRESFDAFLQAKQRAANPSSPSRRSKALGLLSGAPGSSRLNERPSNSLPRISSSPRPKRRKLERDPGLPTPSPSASSQVLDDTAPDNGRNEGGRARSVQTVSSGNDDEYDDQESEAESDAYTDDGLKAGEYVVERLLARSREQARPLQASPAGGKRKRVGKLEWWYLVRWAGYAPSDDTWEPESTLKRGAKKALKLFDAKQHPFQIIGRRGEHETKTQYLVAYGEPGSSPLLEQVWQARRLVGKDHGLQQSVVDAALRDYGRTCSGARTCDWVKQGKGYRTMIEVVDSDSYLPKSNSKARVHVYLVKAWNHQEGREEVVWWTPPRLRTAFGPEDASEGLARFKAEQDRRLAAEAKDAIEAITASEYEQERQRNIRENAALLASLGI